MLFHDGSVTARRPAAWTVRNWTSGDLFGRQEEHDTRRCVHCQCHWEVIPGSGKVRGYCTNCNGDLCGKKACMEHCYPFEKQLDDSEKELGSRVELSPGGLIVPEGSCPL